MNKLKLIIFSLLISLTGVTSGLAGLTMATASASPTPSITIAADLKADACQGLKQVDGSQGCKTGSKTFYKVIRTVVSILAFVTGVAAVIMIIISGLKYITSGGDANQISSAKTGLIYALIGLAVAALAQFLVQFVLSNVKT